MRHKELRLGSITLLFTVVVLCVAALSALTASTAHADRVVSARYASQLDAFYEAERAGWQWLAETDAALSRCGTKVTQADLPQGTTLQNDRITAELETEGGRRLRIELAIGPTPDARYKILCWTNEAVWQPQEDLDGLWSGILPG